MDKSLLVRLFVPVLDPARTEKPGHMGACGTGYPVGPDLILTSRHVVFPPDRDTQFPIEIQWHSHQKAGPAGGWFVLQDEDIVWDDELLDAALLRCPRPAAARGFGFVSARQPATGAEWESVGFPRVAKYSKIRHEEHFRGSMHSMASDKMQFTIDASAAPPNSEDWSGASGMPVCLQRTQLILGIVKQVPQGYSGQKLHVTPSFRLLESGSFRQTIGYDIRARRRTVVETELARVLASSRGGQSMPS